MKKQVMILIALIVMTLLPVTANANSALKVYVNGRQSQASPAPVWNRGTVYAPLGMIHQVLGADAEQNGTHLSIRLDRSLVQMELSGRTAAVNGKSVTLRHAPVIMFARPYVPLKFVADSLGDFATIDKLANAVYIFLKSNDPVAVNSEASNSAGAGQAGKPPVTAENAPPASSGSTGTSSRTDVEHLLAIADGLDNSDTPVHNAAVPEISGIQTIDNGIRIQANGILKPQSFIQPAPTRLVIDFPNTILAGTINGRPAEQNGQLQVANPWIRDIRYALFSRNPNTVRVVLDMKKDVKYSIRLDSTKHTAIVSLKTSKYKVVIDPGHGGHDPGAPTLSGKNEKAFTLAMGLKVYHDLQQYPSIQPYLTRKTDTFISLNDRVAMANNRNADLFLSIHGNISDSPAVYGTETYYWNSYSLDFAKRIEQAVSSSSGFKARYVRKTAYRVVKYTDMPAALVEVGYLSNRNDERDMFEESFQNRVAKAIASAIYQQLVSGS